MFSNLFKTKPEDEQQTSGDEQQQKSGDNQQEKPEDDQQEKPEDDQQKKPKDDQQQTSEDNEKQKQQDNQQQKPQDNQLEILEGDSQENLQNNQQKEPENIKNKKTNSNKNQESVVKEDSTSKTNSPSGNVNNVTIYVNGKKQNTDGGYSDSDSDSDSESNLESKVKSKYVENENIDENKDENIDENIDENNNENKDENIDKNNNENVDENDKKYLPEDDPKLQSAKLVNSLFTGIYFKIILYLLYIAIILLIIFIFILPFLVILHSTDSTFYKTANNGDILVGMLLKYDLTKYNWCNLSTFSEGLSNYFTYKFYTPVVIIFYSSILIYFTFLLFFLHAVLLVIISLLTGGDVNKLNNEDIKNNFTKLTISIAIIYLLWFVIYCSFYIIILRFVKQAFDYNNYINESLHDIITNTNIFPTSKQKQKNELFDNIIDGRNKPLSFMKNYYSELDSFKFKDPIDCAKFLVIYTLLEYFNYVDATIDDPKYRDKIKHYLLNPLDNKDLLIGFTLDNFTLQEFIDSDKFRDIDDIITDFFGTDIPTDDKMEIRTQYNKILENNLIELLNKSNSELSRIQLHIYPIVIIVVVMIIIYILTTNYKKDIAKFFYTV